MADKWIAITGCNGYIGGQTALRFKDLGYKVLGVDRNNTAPWIAESLDQVIKGDFNNAIFINSFIDKNPVALIHIAGTSLVGPSLKDPGLYYANNVGSTAKLLATLAERGWHKTVVWRAAI
jgi:UDP-glucose 4-epimerase